MNLRIKHSKIKNVALLFEVLARKITADVLDGKNDNVAISIIKKYFKNGTELRKEYDLYTLLMRKKFNSEVKANEFINLVIENRKLLNNSKLRREKYNIIKELKENYNIDDLFAVKFDNYSVMAAIYKLFEYNTIVNEAVNPEDFVKSKFTIVNYMIKKNNNQVDDEVLNEFKKQGADLKLLTTKILIDKFNRKYKDKLSKEQKLLVREYINNISSSNSIKKYISENLPSIKSELSALSNKISDNAIVIKINEMVKHLDKLTTVKRIEDKHIISLMKVYELIDNLKEHTCED